MISPVWNKLTLLILLTATGSKTTYYNVLDHGDPNETMEEEEREKQYLMKWKGWSHIHNTWETETALVEGKYAGMKKLENFMKKEQEFEQW